MRWLLTAKAFVAYVNRTGLLLLSATPIPETAPSPTLMVQPTHLRDMTPLGMLLLSPSDTEEYVPAGAESVLMVPYDYSIITPTSDNIPSLSAIEAQDSNSLVSAGSYKKTDSTVDFNARAYTPDSIGSSDVWEVSMALGTIAQQFLGVGTVHPSTYSHITNSVDPDIACVVYPVTSTWYRIVEYGVVKLEETSAAIAAGDVFKIYSDGGVVKYSLNDVDVYTSTIDLGEVDRYIDINSYKVDGGFESITVTNNNGLPTPAVKAPPAAPDLPFSAITTKAGASSTGDGNYSKTANGVFNAQAYTAPYTPSVANEDWECSHVLTSSPNYHILGITQTDPSTYTHPTASISSQLLTGIYVRTATHFRVYQSGSLVLDNASASIAAGDTFTVKRESGVITWYQNDVAIYTSGITINDDQMWVDMNSYNAITLDDIAIGETLLAAASGTDAQERSDKVYGKSGAVGQGVELEWTLARTTGFVIGLVGAVEFDERPPSGSEVNKYSGLQVHHNGTEFIIYENRGDYYDANVGSINDVTIPATIAIGDTVKIDANWGSGVRVLHNDVLIHTGSQTYPFHYDITSGTPNYPIDYHHRAISQNFESGDLYHSINILIT